MNIRHWILTAACAVATVSVASADVVTLADGSQLIGKVKTLSEGKLILVTAFAGELTLDFANVVSLDTDTALNVSTATGNRFVGRVASSGQDLVVTTDHAPVPLKHGDVWQVWPEGEKSPEMLALEKAIAAREEALWSATIEIGGIIKEGNTDRRELRGLFELRRKSHDDLLRFYSAGNYAEQNDSRSEAELIGGIDYERDITKRFNWYTGIELEYDEFENLDLRTTAKVGLGYYWLREEKVDLRTRLGVGYLHESFNDGTNDDRAFTDIGLALRWDIAEWVRLTHDALYRPGWDDFTDYKLRFDTALAIPIGTGKVWKFKIGMLNEYDSRPAPGVERLDNTYYSSIVIDIK